MLVKFVLLVVMCKFYKFERLTGDMNYMPYV